MALYIEVRQGDTDLNPKLCWPYILLNTQPIQSLIMFHHIKRLVVKFDLL